MLWPFGRRKAAKLRDRSTVAERKRPVAAAAHEFATSDPMRASISRRSSRRRRRRSTGSTASMHDVQKSLEKHSPPLPPVDAPFAKESRLASLSAEEITALPNSKRLEQSPHLRPISQQYGIPYNFQSNSHSSLAVAKERGRLQRPQSLRKPPNDSSLVRRKSSKMQKREHDHIREEEIRAMSRPVPQKRPAGNSGGMLRRDSKKVKGSLNRRLERPTSDVSLPLQDSIHSSMSGNSDPRAFRVSALDMLSPRPKIRCSVGTQYYYGGAETSPASNKSKHDTSHGRSLAVSRADQDDKRTSRIDDLADTLDAGALREILERDKRRRDKKRRADEDRLRRRLDRRAERERNQDAGGTPSTPRRQNRGAIGLGIEKETATPMEDVRPTTPQQTQRPQALALTPKVEEAGQLLTPLESPTEEAVVSDVQHVRYSRGSVSGPGHTRGPSAISHLPELLSKQIVQETPVESVEHAFDPTASGSLHAVETADTAANSGKGAGRRRSSEGQRMSAFASFFRRGKRRSQDQGRTTPSEISFSNTSRESMSRQPLPAHLVATMPTPSIPIKQPSSVPRRTMSKFREDLPETYPISPPDSRVQSPEVTSGTATTERRRSYLVTDARVGSTSSGTGGRTDSPVSPGLPGAGLMSQSLASVDSEASWLSGKPLQRRSNMSYFRSSVGSSSALKPSEEFSASYEELGVPEDEYFKTLTPRPEEQRHHSGLLGDKLGNEDAAAVTFPEEEEVPPPTTRPSTDEELVQSTVQRQPTIVHRQARVKSTEGLLSYYLTDEPSPDESAHTAERAGGESPVSEGEPITVERAKSVDFGKHHVRHLSAGSAKLLSIGKRSSSPSQSKLQQPE